MDGQRVLEYFHSKDCVVNPNLCLHMEIEETENFSQSIQRMTICNASLTSPCSEVTLGDN